MAKPKHNPHQATHHVNQVIAPKVPHMLTLPADITVGGKKTSIKVFIDSGGDIKFINVKFALSLGMQIFKPTEHHRVLALDGHPSA